MRRLKILLFFVLWFPSPTWASTPVVLDANTPSYLLGPHLEFLRDPEGKLSIEAITSSTFSDSFTPSQTETPNFGFTSDAYWVRIRLQNPLSNSKEYFLEVKNPFFDHVHFYVFQEGILKKVKKTGDTLPFYQREIAHRHFVFSLTPEPGKITTLYLRLQLNGPMNIPLELWEGAAFSNKTKQEYTLLSLYHGALSSIFIYNLFLFFSLRNRVYFYYVAYLIFAGGTFLSFSGVAFEWIWPNFPLWSNVATNLMIAIDFMMACLFTREYLNTRQNAPLLDKLLLIFIVILGVEGIAVTFFKTPFLVGLLAILVILFTILCMVTGWVCWSRKVPSAQYYLLAWSCFLIGLLLMGLRMLSLLPDNFITLYAIYIGSALEVVLFSFGVADRINHLRKEKEVAQGEALEAQRMLNDELGNQVMIRTKELVEKNTELALKNEALNRAYDDLKTTQTHLVHSEKMAGLGTLVAGVAHEFNNPTNYVSVGAKSLKTEIEAHKNFLFNLLNAEGVNELQAQFEQRFDRCFQTIQHIYDGCNRIKLIVDDLRTFSRLGEAEKKQVDLAKSLQSTLRLLQTQFQEKIEFVCDLTPPLMLDCYPAELNQVFLNIILNGCEALQVRQAEDPDKNRLTITAYPMEHAIHIVFQDEGIGMSKEVQQKMFEPFFTTKTVGQGTGLGMSTVYGIVEKHHGQLKVNSVEGEGTTIEIVLPRVLAK